VVPGGAGPLPAPPARRKADVYPTGSATTVTGEQRRQPRRSAPDLLGAPRRQGLRPHTPPSRPDRLRRPSRGDHLAYL